MKLEEIKKKFKNKTDLVVLFNIEMIDHYRSFNGLNGLFGKLGIWIHTKRLNKHIKLKYHGM